MPSLNRRLADFNYLVLKVAVQYISVELDPRIQNVAAKGPRTETNSFSDNCLLLVSQKLVSGVFTQS